MKWSGFAVAVRVDVAGRPRTSELVAVAASSESGRRNVPVILVSDRVDVTVTDKRPFIVVIVGAFIIYLPCFLFKLQSSFFYILQ